MRDDRGKKASARLWSGQTAAHGLVVLFVLPFVITAVVIAINQPYGVLILLATLGPPLILLGIVIATGRLDPRREEFETVKAARGCPACLYSLEGCREEADGCTICPECGAAWRMAGEGSKSAKQHSSK